MVSTLTYSYGRIRIITWKWDLILLCEQTNRSENQLQILLSFWSELVILIIDKKVGFHQFIDSSIEFHPNVKDIVKNLTMAFVIPNWIRYFYR